VRSCGLDTYDSGQITVVGSCVHDNEPSASIKDGEFNDQLNESL